MAAKVDPARAASLNTRFEHEEQLLTKARERPLFGWGSWGRNRIYTETGRDISLTDGQWVVQIGTGGWLRYVSIFGLLCWPILKMFFFYRRQIDAVTAALVLILCAKLTDMIPNAGWVPVIWLVTGSMMGQMERLAGRKTIKTREPTRQASRYARSFSPSQPETSPARPTADLVYKRSQTSPGYHR